MTALFPVAAARAVAAVSFALSLALAGCETTTAGLGAPLSQVMLAAKTADKNAHKRDTTTARRCESCGWIQSRREILPAVSEPRAPMVYEYTVRMADGSSSIFLEELATWRLGERLVLIAGTGPLN